MIYPRMEMAVAVSVALRSASAAARDFCAGELRRKSDDAAYVSIIRDVMAGYDQRVNTLREELDIILKYIDPLATMMEHRFGPSGDSGYWLYELAKSREILGKELLKAMDIEFIPRMNELCNYLTDCAYPDNIVQAHNEVQAKLRDLHSMVTEFVELQENYRKDTKNEAYAQQRANELINSKKWKI